MNLEATFQEPGLWRSVWKLVRLRLVIMLSGFRRAKTGTKISYIILWLLLFAFMGFIAFLSFTILTYLRSPALAGMIADPESFLTGVPTLIASVSAAGILLTSFGVLLQALYLSGDMDFLMSTPVPVRAVFMAKLVQAVLPNFIFMCVFSLPVLFGLGLSGGYHFIYYPLVLVVLVAITLASASLASLLVMAAVRFFPARRMAEVLGFVIGIFFMVWSQSARFMDWDVNERQVGSLLQLTGRFDVGWSPLAWAGNGLAAVGQGNWLTGMGLLGAALVVTGLVFYGALTVSEKLYHSGWSQLQNNRRRRKTTIKHPAEPAAQARWQPFGKLIPRPVRTILAKDLLLYRRDLRHMSQLITPLILGVVYAISLLRPGGANFEGRGEAPDWVMTGISGVMAFAGVGLALFLGWMLVANLAGMSFSSEGRSYWMLKTAPVSSRQLLMAKFLVGYLPALAISGVYVVVLEIFREEPVWSMFLSLVGVALTLAAMTAIYLAFGTRGAKFDWDTPQQMNRSIGCLGNLVGMVILPVCFGLLVAPVLLASVLRLPVALGQLMGLLLCAGACTAVVGIAYKAVEPHVSKLNEI